MMERFGIRWGSLLLLWAWAWTAVAQPGPRYHTDHKKAIKAYQKAVDAARVAMAPSADRSALEDEVESLLSKALALDPEFRVSPFRALRHPFIQGVAAQSVTEATLECAELRIRD